MSICTQSSSDPLMQQLVKHGINIVLPPRDGIEAGDLLISDKPGAARRANWEAVLGIDVLPKTAKRSAATSTNFKSSANLVVSAGASAAGRILSVFGLSSGRLSAAFSKTQAKTLRLSLVAPACRSLENLDEILGAIRLSGALPGPSYADRRMLVVEWIWRARGMRVELIKSDGKYAEISTAIVDELSAATAMTVASEGGGVLGFKATKALVFGVSLRELIVNVEQISDRTTDVHYTFRSIESPKNNVFISPDDTFVDLV
jgi:hypothetical protein